MHFNTLTDKRKIADIRRELSEDFRARARPRGSIVCRRMPALPEPFPKLLRRLQDSKRREEFMNSYYYIKSENGNIRKLIPVTEYYKEAFRAIAEKRYSLGEAARRVDEIVNEIRQVYKHSRRTLPRTGQPALDLLSHEYELKGQIASFLFHSRSLLDTLSNVFHFLYGRSFGRPKSFGRFADDMRGKRRDIDRQMGEYLSQKLDWYGDLRGFRDWVTHHSSIDITLWESEEGKLDFFLEHHMPVQDLMGSVLQGIDAFVFFVDSHFSKRVF